MQKGLERESHDLLQKQVAKSQKYVFQAFLKYKSTLISLLLIVIDPQLFQNRPPPHTEEIFLITKNTPLQPKGG